MSSMRCVREWLTASGWQGIASRSPYKPEMPFFLHEEGCFRGAAYHLRACRIGVPACDDIRRHEGCPRHPEEIARRAPGYQGYHKQGDPRLAKGRAGEAADCVQRRVSGPGF